MKRIISFILVICFLFSSLSVLADDYGIMLLFQTDISEIENNIKNGTRYLSSNELGEITREKIVGELTDHENDSYYIGTPYHRSDWQSPRGDNSYNGSTSMNCAGFVCYVLRKCGLNSEKVIEYVKRSKDHAKETGNLAYDLISKASNYYELIKEADLVAYAFETKRDMLNSGMCAKGDIILMYVNGPNGLDYGEDNHIGFFWGDNSSDDRFWHSSVKNNGGNAITKITEGTACYILIKLDESMESISHDGEFKEYILNKNLTLKSSPNKNSEDIVKISKNEKVTLINKYSLYWYEVEINGKKGYLPSSGLIALIESEEDLEVETPENEERIESVAMFRLYDPNSSEHFYTGSEEERDILVSEGWNYEGVGFNFPIKGKPVYRLYEPVTGEHLYTMDENEKQRLLENGWNYENVAFNSASSSEVPQYRLYNPNATRGAYHFTGSEEERDWLVSLGWQYQGIGWYSSLK